MTAHADVVIIGAGVIGCSTAYHLARTGIPDVAVVEMGQVGSGSSGKSASMLSLQFCHDDLSVRMAKYSYARYMQFKEELGVPIDLERLDGCPLLQGRALRICERMQNSCNLLVSKQRYWNPRRQAAVP